MADFIPIEIQEEIIKRLPVKSLIKFRSVSKAWKYLIDSTRHVLHPQRLILLYRDPRNNNYLTFDLDDQTNFPQNRSVLTLPLSVERLKSMKIVGSSGGLLCLVGYYGQDPYYINSYPNFSFVNRKVVIWNPSIRKAVIVPNLCFSQHGCVIGFGVSPLTGDPTVVDISRKFGRSLQVVRVFKLSTGVWTNPSNNLPTHVYHIVKWSHVVLDKFIYWVAYHRICETGTKGNLILSFDMTNDEFGVLDLPEPLAFKAKEHFKISTLRESLVVLEYGMRHNVCDVWVMENIGAHEKSFKKLFTVREPNAEVKILGFNKSDHAIMEILGYDESEDPEKAAFAVYDPNSKHITDLGINNGEDELFYMNTYIETLLLLDQPELKASD